MAALPLEILLLVVVGFVAFANGSNDNFKGVATLYGSGTTSYRGAIAWATFTTLAGLMTAVFLSVKLVAAFGGKGLVPDALTHDPRFVFAAGLGAGATVLIARATMATIAAAWITTLPLAAALGASASALARWAG